MKPISIAGKRVVVMGLGRFGGGVAVARWLAEEGARVTVTDREPREKLAESVAQLEGLSLTLHLGGHDEADLDGCDLLVVSPAVPRDRSAFVQAAIARGIPLTSEMNLFVERCPARRVVGVTGSAGKSTTTAMIDATMQEAARAGVVPGAWMGGNIGRSLLGELPRIACEDIVVLELSSFQLDDLAALRWSPSVAVITNLEPNHIDRHGTFEAYAEAKLNIVRWQSAEDVVLIHEEQDVLARRVEEVGIASRVERFSFDRSFSEALQLPGRHNRDNAAAAVAVARWVGVPDEVIRRGLAAFRGLPHRLEFVAECDGVRFYNDSKSTTPESTRIAMEAFACPVVVLVGGADKGAPFDELGRALAARAKAVVCYGATGETIRRAVMGHLEGRTGGARAACASSFEEAVDLAAGFASPGDAVVLSPACASFDMFTHYEERGDRFRALIHARPEVRHR